MKNGSLKSTAEYQLLLGALALPGIFVGAWLSTTRFGRKWTMMTGFAGYLIIGLVRALLLIMLILRDHWHLIRQDHPGDPSLRCALSVYTLARRF